MKAIGVGLAIAVAACGSPQRGNGVKRDDAIVYIDANVGDAGLWLDGVFIGGLESIKGGVAIAAGTHRVEVRHDDYFAYYAEVALAKGEKTRLKVELAPVLP